MCNLNYILIGAILLLAAHTYFNSDNYYGGKIIEGMNGSRKDQPLYVFGMAALLIYLLLTRESPTLKKMGA